MSRHVKPLGANGLCLFFGWDNPLQEYFYQEWAKGTVIEWRSYRPNYTNPDNENKDPHYVTMEQYTQKLAEYKVHEGFIELIEHGIPI